MFAARPNRLCVWAGLILLLTGFPTLSSANSKWFTRVWQMDDGLVDNDINSIVQGPDGYLWLVTPSGLMRFDGVKFSLFPLKYFTGRTAFNIRNIFCGCKGVLWMAFDDGKVVGLNPDFSIVPLQNDILPTRSPIATANDKAGGLWLGYPDAIYRVRSDEITELTAKGGVPSGTVHALTSDGVGNIWLAKGNQICCFRSGKFHRIASVEGVQCMATTHTNAVWLVADAHLLSCNVNGTLRDCGAFQRPSNARAVALMEGHNGSVWIGTHGNGLFCYTQLRFERIKTSQSTILSLAEDHEGDIWVGTGGGGLDRITPRSIELGGPDDGKLNDEVESICQDSKDVLWGATESGILVSRISGRWKPVFTNAWFAGTVTCVAAGRSAVWLGTQSGKLLRIANTSYTTWETNTAQAPIRGLLVASHGDLWVVGRDALQLVHKRQIKNIRLPRQVRVITAVAEDVSGNIWIGANNGILLRLNKTKIVSEASRLRISLHSICCLYGTQDGSLWIGSRGGGLMRLKNGHVNEIDLDPTLDNVTISQIVEDRRGWLWFGSNHGIFKLRERDVERAIEDHSLRLRPIIYGKNEGAPGLEAVSSIISPFVLPRAILSANGHVWMLMESAMVEADTGILPREIRRPPVLLTRVIMDGQTIASYSGIEAGHKVANLAKHVPLHLPPSYRHLDFDFTAFNFSAPENIRFRYQLKGFDKNWIDAGRDRSVSYSRLSPGHYRFCVEASIGDGPWSQTPATLAFTVFPFFWQTWSFRIGALLLFTLSLIAIVRYLSHRRLQLKLRSMAQLAAVERERARIARDIHDDLGNRLTEIQLLTGLGERNREISKNAMARFKEISSAAQHATDALDEIVWAVNPSNDTLPNLINYIGQFTTGFMRAAGIHCHTDLPENPPSSPVSAEIRHNLFLAVKESLNNIARHSNATEVSIIILVTNQSLSIIIEDNGLGFNGQPMDDGADGLKNLRHRITEIGGQFQIESNLGNGTRITFTGSWLANSKS